MFVAVAVILSVQRIIFNSLTYFHSRERTNIYAYQVLYFFVLFMICEKLALSCGEQKQKLDSSHTPMLQAKCRLFSSLALTRRKIFMYRKCNISLSLFLNKYQHENYLFRTFDFCVVNETFSSALLTRSLVSSDCCYAILFSRVFINETNLIIANGIFIIETRRNGEASSTLVFLSC